MFPKSQSYRHKKSFVGKISVRFGPEHELVRGGGAVTRVGVQRETLNLEAKPAI